MSQAFQNLSQAARDFASTNELNSESVGKFVQGQQQAIDVMQKTSLASKAAAVGMGLLNAAMTGLITVGVSFVIQSLITLIDDLNESQSELIEKTKNLRAEYESLQSEIESTQSELDKINQTITELNSKDHLTFAEQGELANLQAQRAELEQILAVKKALAEEDKQAASNAAIQYFNTGVISDTQNLMFDNDQIEQEIARINQLIEYGTQKFGANSEAVKSLKQELQNLNDEYENKNGIISDNVQNIILQAESLYGDSEAVKSFKKEISDLYTAFLMETGDTDGAYTTFISGNIMPI